MFFKKNFLATEIEPLEVTESIIVGVDKEKDDSMEAAQQSTKSTFTIIYDMFSHVMMLSYSSGKHTVGKKSLAAAATCIPQKEFVYTSYKLPSYYGQNLDIKMKNGVPFNFLDYSSLARELGKSIQQHSTASDPKIIRFVVCKLVSEYPDLLGREEENKADFQVNTNFPLKKFHHYLNFLRILLIYLFLQ